MEPIVNYEEELIRICIEKLRNEIDQIDRTLEKNKKIHNWYFKI